MSISVTERPLSLKTWTSLVSSAWIFLVARSAASWATSVKIFLVDLSRLRDLYRVASLLGLAVSLLAVSVAYQRFVLRARPKAP